MGYVIIPAVCQFWGRERNVAAYKSLQDKLSQHYCLSSAFALWNTLSVEHLTWIPLTWGLGNFWAPKHSVLCLLVFYTNRINSCGRGRWIVTLFCRGCSLIYVRFIFLIRQYPQTRQIQMKKNPTAANFLKLTSKAKGHFQVNRFYQYCNILSFLKKMLDQTNFNVIICSSIIFKVNLSTFCLLPPRLFSVSLPQFSCYLEMRGVATDWSLRLVVKQHSTFNSLLPGKH